MVWIAWIIWIVSATMPHHRPIYKSSAFHFHDTTLQNELTANQGACQEHYLSLSHVLPPSIQQGTKDDKIWCVMNAGERDNGHETFNRHFDAMFGEDCQDSNSRLLHIRRGKLGRALVTSYLSEIDWSHGFPLDIVEIKLQRLLTELTHLQYVANFVYHSRLTCF
jgi:hypothetical protein